MKKYLIPILMIAVLLSAVLAGCGSEKEDDSKTTSDPKATEATAATIGEEGELPAIAVDEDDAASASEEKNAGGSTNQASDGKQSADNGGSSGGSSGNNSGKDSGSSSGNGSGSSSGDKSDKDSNSSSSKDSGKSTSPTTADKGKNEPTVPSEISQYIEENGEDELPFVPA